MKKVLMLAGLSLALAACGSGGNGGSSNNEGNVVNPTPKSNASGINVPAELVSQVKQIKMIKINDQVFDLMNEPVGFMTKSTSEKTIARIYNQTYSLVGYIQPKYVGSDRIERLKQLVELNKIPSNKRSYSNFVSTKFENIPTQGTATYMGAALAGDLEGKFKLDADFSTKNVSGEITDLKEISTGANQPDFILNKAEITSISENVHFRGLATSNNEIYGYAGGFAGPNAEEVYGAVVKSNGNLTLEFLGKK